MLSIFKNKTPLIDDFPENFIDIHCHLLPNVDDGSKSFEESLLLLKRMHFYGIKHVVLTPHIMEGVWENSSVFLNKRFNELNDYLQKSSFNEVRLHLAAEYMLDSKFNSLLKQEKLLTLKDDFLLIEMSYLSPPINLYETIFEIQMAGYKPILAHPERYKFLHNHFEEYHKLKNVGCYFQLNLLSLTNYYGNDVKNTAIKLLKEKLIDFVGSDTHHQRHLNSLEKINNKAIIQLIKPILQNNAVLNPI